MSIFGIGPKDCLVGRDELTLVGEGRPDSGKLQEIPDGKSLYLGEVLHHGEMISRCDDPLADISKAKEAVDCHNNDGAVKWYHGPSDILRLVGPDWYA